MQVPLEIAFRNVPRDPEVESLIRDKLKKLERMADNLISGEVVIERRHASQQSGNPYRVRLSFKAPPGHDLTVVRKSIQDDTEQPLPTVIRDAFESLRRQVKELKERQRQEVKTHTEQQVMAVVDELVREDGFGFLKTVDGRRVYFHKNSVANDDFDRLTLGCGVSFTEIQGVKGPQASVVQIVDKPGRRRDKAEQ